MKAAPPFEVSFNHPQFSRSVLLLLQDQELARQLVELGHKGSSLEREEFETSKAAAEASRLASESQQKKLASIGKELKDNFLRALAEREEANRSGEMTVSTLLQHSICYVMGFPQNSSPSKWSLSLVH
uniref:Cilia- and flagella-associated protein 299 n=1 Tax=Cyprinus carpio TaxID=7962 RepID=A0A8C1BPM8_CYPCA